MLVNLITPLGALASPIVGWTMGSRGFAFTYAIVNLLGMLLQALVLIDNLPLQVLSFVVWAFFRMYCFSATYGLISHV